VDTKGVVTIDVDMPDRALFGSPEPRHAGTVTPNRQTVAMEEDRAVRIVAALRERGVMAHLARAGVYQTGVRVVIPDGREAVWDTDGAAGLEAQILRDGVLVGFVPQINGSENFDDDEVIAAIAMTEYGDS
jgi:hypothetical protein